MKKLTFLIIFTVGLGYISNAQLSLGLKGAVTMNTLSSELEDYNKAAKVGFQAGAFVRLGGKLHIQPEAYFATRTGEADFTYEAAGNDVNVNQDLSLSTVDVPLLLGYKLMDTQPMNIRLQAGPVASFVVNKDLEIDSGGGLITEKPFEEEDFRNVNWGLQLGGGVDFLFLTLDLRYEIGLSPIYDSPSDVDQDPKFKYNLWFVSLGFKII